ncbi:hypothetical protein PENSPDRAFT_750939 [Peniophora sp. CONT]|nr:hypothetical protein PENSPDRAFT_750939 [Peniophora sp. CONT]
MSLPDELLAEIFLHLHSCRLADAEREGFAYHPVPPWVTVSHVCTRWRNVALRCKKLWSFVVDADCHWTEVSVKRSNPLPISMRAEIYPTTPLKSIFQLINSVPLGRLASVQIWVNASCPFDPALYSYWLNKLVNSPTPLLEHFEIAAFYDRRGIDFDEPSEVTTNIHLRHPWDYLGKSKESPLRSLVLSGCTFTTLFSLHGSSKLVSLRIEDSLYAQDDDGEFLGFQHLRYALSASPDLEELYLLGSIPTRGATPNTAFKRHTINLSRLREFRIEDDFEGGLNLLSHLSIPMSANTCIIIEQYDHEEGLASQISKFRALDGLFLAATSSPYRVLAMAQARGGESQRPSDRVGFRTLLSDFRACTTPVSPLLEAIVTLLLPQLSSIHTLVIGIRPVIFDCLSYFSTWSIIQTLHVYGTATALSLFEHWHTITPHALPNVISLVITRADLTADATVEKLIHAIVQRQLISSPCAKLEHLVLGTPLVHRQTIKTLAKILAIKDRSAVCVRDETCDTEGDAIQEEDRRAEDVVCA